MRTEFTVFFSWQTDKKENIKIIKSELEAQALYMKEKYGYSIHILDGTRDVPGMPPIERIVMDRINECDVYVCDITPIEEHEVTPVPNRKVKQMPNSSVMIELGYALRCMSYERIIAVAHSGTWHDSELPFDINHMRFGRFNSKSCDLRFELETSILHVAKYGRTKPYDDSLYGRIKQFVCKRLDIYDEKSFKHASLLVEPELDERVLPKAVDLSVVMFARRMAEAFPGIRGVKWITSKSEIKRSLKTFFHEPLKFANSEHGCGDPIWWFRGGSAMNCSSFESLCGRKVRIGTYRLNIDRIAIFRDSGMYNREYIYIEARGEKQVGVNNLSKEYIEESISFRGYAYEEYAEFKLAPFINIPIKEEDYDDGHTIVCGRIFTTRGRSKLTTRYLTRYNLLIAAKGSPYNSHEFDRESADWMNGLLKGEVKFEEFHNFLMQLPRNPLEDNL